MLEQDNSYIRTRGLVPIARNALAIYPDSMISLVTKDVMEALSWIEQSIKQNG